MGNNAADTSVVDAIPASDSAAKRLTGDERRREILDAVRTVSSELGVSHLSVSAVTKRAGCTRSLFYHYFADMDAAVTAVMDEAIDGFISELEQWNAGRTVGDIEGALDTVAPLFKRLVVSGHELPSTLTSSSGALYGGFLHNVVQRVAQYICDTTVVDFVAHHELRIDHVYETFYTLIMGLLMYIRTHPD
uniref:TetR/AcrR family transcriptional regulator n=1 Tax=Collinsella sp. TaxID=1965294 RepID=UPI0040262752